MSPVVKKKLLGVIVLFVVAIAMQFVVKSGDPTMIWASIGAMAVVAAYLFKVC